jgi:fructoselysine 6-kinase
VISVVGVGDNTVDRYVEQGLIYPGGNAVNVAVHARRLGYESAYIGCVGDDAAGTLIYNALSEEGVDVSRMRRMEGENAFCDIRLVDGERVFGDYSGGLVDQLVLNKGDFDFLSRFDLVHTSVYSFLDDMLAEIKAHAKYLSYDFSNEWDDTSLANVLPMVDFALISRPAADKRDNTDLLKWAAARGPKLVMVTSGDQGAAVYDGTDIYFQPIIPIENVIDTLGAGDAFAACFLTQYIEKGKIEEALGEAARYAASACTQHGAFGHGTRYIM